MVSFVIWSFVISLAPAALLLTRGLISGAGELISGTGELIGRGLSRATGRRGLDVLSTPARRQLSSRWWPGLHPPGPGRPAAARPGLKARRRAGGRGSKP